MNAARRLVSATCVALAVCAIATAAPIDVRPLATYGRGAVTASATSEARVAIAVANEVALFSADGLTHTETLSLGRAALLDSIALTHDGRWVAGYASDGAIELWDTHAAPHSTYANFPLPPVGEHALRLRADGGAILAAWEHLPTGELEWYSLPTDGSRAAVLADGGPPEAGPDTRWEPDGMVGPRTHRALTVGWMPAGRRKTLEVWSSAERRPVLSTGLRSARWFRFSDDGRFLAVGTYDRAGVRVYDIASGGPVAMSALAPGDLATCGLPLPERRQRAMLPPGHVFATRPLNVQLVGLLPPQWQEAAAPWVVSAGMRSCDSMPPQVEASYRDQWQELPILAFAYSRPRRLWAVAISSSFGATESTRGIVLWDHDTHERLDALEGHTVFEPSRSGGRAPYVHSVAFGADGRYLISGGADGTVWVWDMRDRTAAATLTGHVGPVRYVAFGADGRRFVSGSEDGTVREWVIEGG